MAPPVAPFPPRRVVADNVYDGMADAVGNTPLIKLQRASRETGCNIYGKAEFMNPVSRSSLNFLTHDDICVYRVMNRNWDISWHHDVTYLLVSVANDINFVHHCFILHRAGLSKHVLPSI